MKPFFSCIECFDNLRYLSPESVKNKCKDLYCLIALFAGLIIR